MLGMDLRDDTPGIPVRKCRRCGLLHLAESCRRCSARWATRQETTATLPVTEQILQVLRSGRATHAYLMRVIHAPGYLVAEALLALQHRNQIRRYPHRPPYYDLVVEEEKAA